jgi:CRISPR-associated endonuclease/helicase Cas3
MSPGNTHTPAFWGKLRRVDSANPRSPVIAWHPLVAHCADVAACLVALLGLRPQGFAPTILNRRLARLGGCEALDAVQVARLGVLAALHDVGKFNHGFQNKAQSNPPFTCGHVQGGMAILDGSSPWTERFVQAAALRGIAAWANGDEALELLAAAISHHGRPAEVWQPSGVELNRCWGPGAIGDPLVAVAGLVDSTRRWLPHAWPESDSRLPGTPEFQHGYCGLVQLADWLGSDIAFFPFSSEAEIDRWPAAFAAAANAIAAVGLDGEPTRKAMVRTCASPCQSRFRIRCR